MEEIEKSLFFRPVQLEDFLLPKRIQDWVDARISENFLRTALFSGGAGKGKTSLARFLVKALDYQFIEINASNERGIDIVREKITNFLGNFNGDLRPKCVIFDECEQLTADASKALKKVVEDYGERHESVFLFITNEPHKINEAILSRCSIQINFDHESDKELRDISNKLYKRITGVFREFGIKYGKNDVVEFIRSKQPDIRKTLGQVYQNIIDGVFVYDSSILSESYIDIIQTICSPTLKFNKIMQWAHDQSKFSPSLIVDKLYESFTVIVDDSGNNLTPHDRSFIIDVIKITDDYSVKLTQSQNPHITLRAMLIYLAEESSIKVLSKLDFGRYNGKNKQAN